MWRWIWAALCVTSTIWLIGHSVEWQWIAINVALDIGAIVSALRGDR